MKNIMKQIIIFKKLLPAKLLPFKNVFDEKFANELPPHPPYDCEIKLKQNTKLH